MIFDPEWDKREPVELELPEGLELEAIFVPAGFTACPWCPASGPLNFMNGHMKRHEDENAIAQMVALQGRIQDWNICTEIADERVRQDEKWGEQNHPDGTSVDLENVARGMRAKCQSNADRGVLTFRDILEEELWEAYAEEDPALLRAELVQCAAVLVNWIGAIDRRKTKEKE